jgi:SAM-dependent methyltransferase
MERPAEVEAAVAAKYQSVQELTGPRPWVHMGQERHEVVLGLRGRLDTDSLAARFLGGPGARLLDLGTGTGELLEHLHSALRLPYSRLVGVSAVDHRPPGSVLPDSSYRILNIDMLGSEGGLEERTFSLVLSFATFYHLVDPVGALPAVHRLLAPGGLALLSHVPLEGALGSGSCYKDWNRSMADTGQPVVFLPQLESPGNYLVVMRGGAAELELPCRYTGEVVSAAGTYQHARLLWEAALGPGGGTLGHWADRAAALLEVQILPLHPEPALSAQESSCSYGRRRSIEKGPSTCMRR